MVRPKKREKEIHCYYDNSYDCYLKRLMYDQIIKPLLKNLFLLGGGPQTNFKDFVISLIIIVIIW